jgi:hypothetical protein
MAAHIHHAWARGPMGGVFTHVEVDLAVHPNEWPVCARCHNDLHEHRAAIRLGSHGLYWQGKEGTSPLRPLGEHVHDDPEQCPTCGRRKRRPEIGKPGKPRETKGWTVSVPNDAEMGADVLDQLVDALAETLGVDHWTGRLRRYHVLCLVLAWSLQNEQALVADLRELSS